MKKNQREVLRAKYDQPYNEVRKITKSNKIILDTDIQL